MILKLSYCFLPMMIPREPLAPRVHRDMWPQWLFSVKFCAVACTCIIFWTMTRGDESDLIPETETYDRCEVCFHRFPWDPNPFEFDRCKYCTDEPARHHRRCCTWNPMNRCTICLTRSDSEPRPFGFPSCWYCGDSPSRHHGRCCPAKPLCRGRWKFHKHKWTWSK